MMQESKTILATLANNAKKTAKEIIKETGIRNGLVIDVLDKMEDLGTIQSDMVDGAIVYFLPNGEAQEEPKPVDTKPVATKPEAAETTAPDITKPAEWSWNIDVVRTHILLINGAFTTGDVVKHFGTQHRVNIYALLQHMKKTGLLTLTDGKYCKVTTPTQQKSNTNQSSPTKKDTATAPKAKAKVAQPDHNMVTNVISGDVQHPVFGFYSNGKAVIECGAEKLLLEQKQMQELMAFFAAPFGYRKIEEV